MEVFQVTDKLPDSDDPVVLVIGKFDGVHKGHQHLLEQAKALCAKEEKLAIVCFTPHPLWALRKDPAYQRAITPDSAKFYWLEHYGVDKVYNILFTTKYAENSAETFIREHLRGLNLRHIVVGESFNFGKGRDSDVDLLITLCGERSVPVTEVPFVKDHAHKISSTDIRAAIADGDFATAEFLLGHPYFIEGEVIEKRGTHWLTGMDDYVIPKAGEYDVTINGEQKQIQIINADRIALPEVKKKAKITFKSTII
ncbi:adenylyltransferase/cytidyltransferase family protein [Listeria booriae]|uniref:adenylyltransferase/cytidyltransferase family protein n=1 Tax=Listeria booriae TaxID=1552123 RepID=UPI0016267CC3|nr:adenylyltransferase/cytidyltransferase family protein [Listeria booriae]MBC2077895.1 adenylyltransferase/cytidyltransferase family protein [Listeria booriae]